MEITIKTVSVKQVPVWWSQKTSTENNEMQMLDMVIIEGIKNGLHLNITKTETMAITKKTLQ